MELTDKIKMGVAAGLLALLLSVLGIWGGRTYERTTLTQSYEAKLTEKDQQLSKTASSLATTMIERGKVYAQLEQMKKTMKSWDRGEEWTDEQGNVHRKWDRGDESAEEVMASLQEQLHDLSESLDSSNEALSLAQTERDSLKVQVLTKETLLKSAGHFRAVLVNWDIEQVSWHTALNTQLVFSQGSFVEAISLKPGGPFRPGNEDKDVLHRIFDLGPSVGLGLRF